MSFWSVLTSLLTKAASKIASLLPKVLLWQLGRVLAFLWWDVLRLRRFTLLRNVTIVFPKMPKEERQALVKKSLCWMGYNFFEILQIPSFTQARLSKEVRFEGLENFAQAKAQGKGTLLLCMHIGNGDAAVAYMSLFGMEVSLITKKFKNKTFNDVWFGLRARNGTKFIDAHGRETAFQILKALKNQNSVAFVLDQFMGRPFGLPTKFFGKTTGTAYGLALFALKTGAPVITATTYRDENFNTFITFGEPIKTDPEIENTQDKDLQMLRMTEKYNQALEKIILAHPEQWMWVHRRWKKYE